MYYVVLLQIEFKVESGLNNPSTESWLTFN